MFKNENTDVSKINQLHYFNKVIEKMHYLLNFKLGNLKSVTYYISKVTFLIKYIDS